MHQFSRCKLRKLRKFCQIFLATLLAVALVSIPVSAFDFPSLPQVDVSEIGTNLTGFIDTIVEYLKNLGFNNNAAELEARIVELEQQVASLEASLASAQVTIKRIGVVVAIMTGAMFMLLLYLVATGRRIQRLEARLQSQSNLKSAETASLQLEKTQAGVSLEKPVGNDYYTPGTIKSDSLKNFFEISNSSQGEDGEIYPGGKRS